MLSAAQCPNLRSGGATGLQQMRWPKRKDIPGVVLVIAVVFFLLYWHLKHPDWQRPSGFGPEWQCTQSGKAGPDFCYKNPPAVSDGNAIGRSN